LTINSLPSEEIRAKPAAGAAFLARAGFLAYALREVKQNHQRGSPQKTEEEKEIFGLLIGRTPPAAGS
jgi:hypothetical protein